MKATIRQLGRSGCDFIEHVGLLGVFLGHCLVAMVTPPVKFKRIPVSYKMKLTDGEWYIYDVIIENVSLVSNYRNLYAAIIKSSGLNGLLNQLELDLNRNTQVGQ